MHYNNYRYCIFSTCCQNAKIYQQGLRHRAADLTPYTCVPSLAIHPAVVECGTWLVDETVAGPVAARI